MNLTLDSLNAAPADEAVRLLDGLYEHSPWVVARALAHRPFATLAALKWALVRVLAEATHDEQLGLIRAHPELAGKAMVAQALTADSTGEQSRAGLTHCTPEEFATLQRLNAAYSARFGFPFILAVRGPRGTGLTRQQIIAAFERRLRHPVDVEREEALRQIHRIAEMRLADRFATPPEIGQRVWDWLDALARHSDPGCRERGELTVTYLTEAHQACQRELVDRMRHAGFDEVWIDAVGNVVGVYHAAEEAGFAAGPPQGETSPFGGQRPAQRRSVGAPKRLISGSHFDTVRNGGPHDGRLGIFVPIACVERLHHARRRLPFGIEVVALAEEEGQRYQATFLGSGALTGHFDPAWLDQVDAEGVAMRQAMRAAELPGTLDAITALRRDPSRYLGFVEVHIEQGPVLHDMGLPLGVVTSINASARHLGEVIGMASHAGTTPMDRRRDAACAVAELALYCERRAAQDGDSVATIGLLSVPGGSINVVPGRCQFSLDLRAPSNAQRDALERDVLAELRAICERRGLAHTVERTLSAAAAPSDPAWQARWEHAVAALGLPVHRLPSGAGHDAMKLHEVMPQAMLFVRGENGGISHNPLESTTCDDIELCVLAFEHLLEQLTQDES